MCTVIFFPGSDKQVFVSLRDEDPRRSKALPPGLQTVKTMSWIGPVDPVGGGTWFAANQQGRVVILLNGGFEKHQRLDRYARSRGLVVTDLVTSEDLMENWNLLNLDEVEPFTLVVWEAQQLSQLVWDGWQKHSLKINSRQPQIWSSATLYDPTARERRKSRFYQWVQDCHPVTPAQLLDFFTSDRDAENGFLINRKETVRTLSFSYLEQYHDHAVLRYQDLLEPIIHVQNLSIAASPVHSLPDGGSLRIP
jgi:hypothetical protein